MPLGRRAVALLQALIEKPGSPLSKDELVEKAWAGLAVEDSNLTVQVSAIRRALGAEPGGELWIETLSVAASQAGATSRRLEPGAHRDLPSIAVLPFENMGNEREQDYFADGIVEEIITALSRFRQLFVIARNSSFTYKARKVDLKQIGEELGVRYVLEGSVRRSGQRVRITGQLIDTESATTILRTSRWSFRMPSMVSAPSAPLISVRMHQCFAECHDELPPQRPHQML